MRKSKKKPKKISEPKSRFVGVTDTQGVQSHRVRGNGQTGGGGCQTHRGEGGVRHTMKIWETNIVCKTFH